MEGKSDMKTRMMLVTVMAAAVAVAAEGLKVESLGEETVRVRMSRDGKWPESGMNRYGVLADLPVSKTGADLGVLAVRPEVKQVGKGFELRFPLKPDTRVFGLGDVCRTNVNRRGVSYEMWVRNVTSYIPVPVAFTTEGWGVFVNTTWRHVIDVGATDRDALVVRAPEGEVDFYFLTAADLRGLLKAYTRITGRPTMLPVWGYGFTYVCNENVDEFKLLAEAERFRDKDFPCDVMGLEPGWMSKRYDYTTRKDWDTPKFHFPSWAPNGASGTWGATEATIWPQALANMGFKLSLWLCCDYDLFRYEEQCAAGLARKAGRQPDLAAGIPEFWQDDRIVGGKTEDKRYRPELEVEEGKLPWFEHLKKFVDQGARCFKLDGGLQVCQADEHPDKVYGNGMHVNEAHNLYPVVYDKQMARGYEEYTGRRPMIYSAGGYAGVQAYVATWAGDTGGGEKTLVSTFNLAFTGHSNQSCDMTIADRTRVHYGFLAPWSQANDWDSFHRPWTEGDEAEASFRHYAKLRYSLFPYLYANAAYAARTGYPIVRPLALAYPDVPAYDDCKTTYMLGDDLLVSAFSDVTEVPAGVWYDWRTGKRVVGPCREPWDQKGVWGGGLLVREGAVIPRWENKMHLPKGWDKDVVFEVWPLEKDGVTTRTWYEDDGDSLKYREGAYTETEVSCETKGEERIFRIAPRRGAFEGMPENHYVKLRIRLEKRPVVYYGKYDWQTKLFEVELGDVDPAKGIEFKLTTADRGRKAKTLRDCSWMWGHDTGVYDGADRGWGIPDSETISMPDACLAFGVPNCCGIRWSYADYEYLKPFRKLDRFTWVAGSVYNNAFTAFEEQNYMTADQYPNFTGFDLDDIFLDKLPPVRALDREGREIRVMRSRPTYAELLAFKDRLANNVMGQRLKIRAVLYSRQIRPEIAPLLELVDTVLFWTWDGKDISKLRTNFETYRKFLPTKETLLGISREIMETQLAFALEKFKAGEIQGVIFHCTPLVNKNLEAVEICRKWLEKNGETPVCR